MKRLWWTAMLTAVILVGWLGVASAAEPDTASIKRPSAALLMRLSRARQLSTQPRTFQTQVGVAVAARRHGDAIEQQKRTLAILNNQYLRGTAASTPSETDIRQTVTVLENQLSAPEKPENEYEVRYYLAACYESLGDTDRAKDILRGVVRDYGTSQNEVVQSFVEQARADLDRLGG